MVGLAFLFSGHTLGAEGIKVTIRHFFLLTLVSIDTILLMKVSIDTDIEIKWGLWKDHLLKSSMEKLNRPKAQ